jgi:hypothetical protein
MPKHRPGSVSTFPRTQHFIEVVVVVVVVVAVAVAAPPVTLPLPLRQDLLGEAVVWRLSMSQVVPMCRAW